MKCLLLLSAFSLIATSTLFGDTISVSPATQNVTAGQTFSVDVNIDNIPDLYDYQFSLSFNPAVLAAQSITEGSLFASTNDSFFIPGAIDNTAGTITLTADTLFGNVPGVMGPGIIAVVDFTALAPGASSIDFAPLSDLILQSSAGGTYPVTPVSGTIDVATPEPATILLISLALGLMAFGVWRRRQHTAALPDGRGSVGPRRTLSNSEGLNFFELSNSKRLAHARPQKAMLCSALAFAGLFAASAHADTITTFAAVGTFQDGATLSGTLTIDTTNGNVVSSTVEALPDASGLNQISVGTIGGVTGISLSAPAGEPSLILDLQINNLIGYTGGPLASADDPATVAGRGSVETALFLPTSTAVFLNSGSLTPETATPEAATFGMIAVGLLALVIQRRQSNKQFLRKESTYHGLPSS